MDIHQNLAEHHRRLEELFDGFRTSVANRDGEAEELFADFESALVAHFEAEELHLFPLLEPDFPEEILALREEHELMRRQLSQMGTDQSDLDAETTAALATRLHRHAGREDNMLYKLVNDTSGSKRYQQVIEYLDALYARLRSEELE